MQDVGSHCDKKIDQLRLVGLRPIEPDAYWAILEALLRPARREPRLERGGASATVHGEGLEAVARLCRVLWVLRPYPSGQALPQDQIDRLKKCELSITEAKGSPNP